jgi:hypothetical protein
MWTRIKFIINLTLICVTCERMIRAWIAQGPHHDRRCSPDSRPLIAKTAVSAKATFD